MAKLTFVLEEDQEVVVPLTERITVGCAEDNDVVVDDERIANHHAEIITLANGMFELGDLGSATGTFVNNERVTRRVLRDGDQLVFGPLHGLFDLEAEAPAAAPPRPPAASTRTTPVALKTTKVPVHTTKVPVAEKPATSPSVPASVPVTGGAAKEKPAEGEDALRAAVAHLEKEKARLEQETAAAEEALEEWRMKATKERNSHENRLSTLRSAEERLLPLQAAAKHAETTHGEWLAAINVLAVEHEEKSAGLLKATQEHERMTAEAEALTAATDSARLDIETLTRQQNEEATRLQQLQQERTQEEARLQQLRQESETSLAELHRKHSEHELSVQEARATLEAQKSEAQAVAEKTAQLLLQQAQAQEAAAKAQADFSTHEESANAAGRRLDEMTQALDQATARLAEVEAQHQSLRLTDHQVAQLNSGLASLVQQHTEAEQRLSMAQVHLAEAEGKLSAQDKVLQGLAAEEATAKGKIQDSEAQKADLEAEAAALSAEILQHQSTLDQVRRHAAEQEETQRALEAARTELQDLTTRLTPLRDWKEAMDQLYARFAALPQGTPESQNLWREIETGKATLIKHIMSLHTRVPRIVHIEFSRQGIKPGTPMKSERVRSQGKT